MSPLSLMEPLKIVIRLVKNPPWAKERTIDILEAAMKDRVYDPKSNNPPENFYK